MGNAATQKILFVTPPYHSGIPEIAGRWMPLGLVYLAGAARAAGVGAEIYDAMAKGDGYPEIERRLRESGARYVAVSAMTASFGDALKTLELAKRIDPATVTILGGIHPSFMYNEVLENSTAVDYVVVGEGEETLRRLLVALEGDEDPATVPGIACRTAEGVTATPAAPLIEDLDALPTAWNLLEWPLYSYFIIPDSRFAAIGTSRGCSRDGAFCPQELFWQKSWRPRDPLKVADEIASLYRRFGANVFLVTDDHPTRDAARWEALLDALIEKELPVHLIVETRAEDAIRDREIVWKYRKAGIVHLSLGIECAKREGSDRAADGGGMVKEALDIIREHGIVSEAAFVLGLPGDTQATVQETLERAQQLNPDNANFFAFTPWPYGGIYDDLKPLIREHDYARYNFIDPVLEPENMSIKEVRSALAECYRKFYMGKMLDVMTMKESFRRAYLLRATKLIMGSPFVINKLNPFAR